jgi:ribosome biogenesis GTPase
MKNQRSELNPLGWTDWFEQRASCTPPDTIARVAAVDRDRLLLMDQSGSFRAKLAGSFLHRHRQLHERPCVGDWVCQERQSGEDFAVVHAVIKRRTSLCRKSVGRTIEYQMIAANMDYVVIVQSCHFDFNVKRLERYLLMVTEGGAEACILLTKTDLVDLSVVTAQIAEIRAAGITAPIVTLSNVTREGVDEFKSVLAPGKTYCFVGSSGVGKSTLINQLIGGEKQQIGAVSGTGEGQHTTVRRELIRLEGGALVIDNPGMREFGVSAAEESVESSHAEITALSTSCRYRNCGHTSEPGCAVLAAVRSGEISQEHFDNYLKLRTESESSQKSYAEKRRKERGLGKQMKSAKKDLKGDR